jgi:hypothetical protein
MPKFVRESKGQALIETTLLVTFVVLPIALNAINFGYFFLMALDVTSSARSSGMYSITGNASPAQIALPAAGPYNTNTSVSYIAFQDLTGSVYSPSTTNTGVNVCSPSVGVLSAGTVNQKSKCTTFGIGSFPAADVDPELNSGSTQPAFMLNRVDVAYQFNTPIPSMPFNIIVLASPACTTAGSTVTCTFYRHTEMRAMN